MSEPRNEHFENMVLVFVFGALLLAGVIYGVVVFWPYFLFYILPFVTGSIVVGGILRLSAYMDSGEVKVIEYKGLAIVYPILLMLVASFFFSGNGRTVIEDKAGHVVAEKIEWPGLNKYFNETRSDLYASSPFESLKKDAKVHAIYDRSDLGWILIWCLFLGGPAFFWILSRDDQKENVEILEQDVAQLVGRAEERVREKDARLEGIIRGRTSVAEAEIAKVKKRCEELIAENRQLKATVEFSAREPSPRAISKGSGVLDQDLF